MHQVLFRGHKSTVEYLEKLKTTCGRQTSGNGVVLLELLSVRKKTMVIISDS